MYACSVKILEPNPAWYVLLPTFSLAAEFYSASAGCRQNHIPDMEILEHLFFTHSEAYIFSSLGLR